MDGEKMWAHIGDLLRWIGQTNYAPELITTDIDLTQRCDCACPNCTYGFNKTGQDMNYKLLQRVMRNVGIGTLGAVLTGGGEPLLHKDIIPALRWLRQRGVDIGLITNGLGLTPDVSEALLGNERVRWIRVSMDAGTPDGYSAAHGIMRDRFVVLRENMERLADMRARRTPTGAPTLGASFLVGPTWRRDEVLAAGGFLDMIGFDYLQLKPMEGVKDGRSVWAHYRVNGVQELAEEMREMWPKLEIRADHRAFKGYAKQTKPYDKCYGAWFSTAIGANGKVYVCCHTKYRPKYEIGDLNHQTLPAILQSHRRKEVMRSLDVSQCLPFCRLDGVNRMIHDLLNCMVNAGINEHRNFL